MNNDQLNQAVSPESVFSTIAELFNKLVEAGLSNKQMTISYSKEIINEKMVYTVSLLLDGDMIASNSVMDSRPLEVIKEEALEKQVEIETKKEEEKSQFNEVVQLIESVPVKEVVAEKPAEEVPATEK